MSPVKENISNFLSHSFKRKDKGRVASAVATPVPSDGTTTPIPNPISDGKVSENNEASNWTGKLTFTQQFHPFA
jgi:hypothetical protein